MATIEDRVAAGTPFYSIGSVARLAGVTTATLRTWESRYGIPRPVRSSRGGQRLYTAEEVALVRLLVRKVSGGQPIRKAVAEVREAGSASPLLAASFRQAIQDMNAATARQTIAEAGLLLTPQEVWSDIVAPVLRELGAHCAATGSGISAEHLASDVVRTWLHGLVAMLPMPGDGPLIAVACGPGEYHELSTLMFSVRLQLCGRRVLYLGAATPPSALTEVLAIPDIRVLCVTATLPSAASVTADALLALARTAPPCIRLAYGGPGFEDTAVRHDRLRDHALYLGDDLDTAVMAVLGITAQEQVGHR